MNPFNRQRKASYICAHCLRDLGEFESCLSCSMKFDRARELRQLHREVFVATMGAIGAQSHVGQLHSINVSFASQTADAAMQHWASVERDREATIAHVLEPTQ